MELVGQGKSRFVIIPENNNLAAEFAAQELKKYLFKCTGVNLPIENKDNKNGSFYVGGNRYEGNDAINVKKMDLNGDGFILRITETNIYLDSQNGKGLIFGVYRFLEKYLGVRFFNYDCELVPTLEDIVLENGVTTERPVFALRSYLNGELWQCGAADVDLYFKFKQNNEHLLIDKEKYGCRCPMDGRNGAHNMSTYVPYEIYKDSHPEFYYYNADLGYRTIDLLNGITDDGELDESIDVSVAKIVIEEMKKDILANKDILYFQFEQEDGDTMYQYKEGTKQYEILQKYKRSGILIRFCNVIARKIKEWADKELGGRNFYLVTFAYGFTKEPPVKVIDGKTVPIDKTVIVDDNIVIRYAMNTSGVNCAYDHFHQKNSKFIEFLCGWRILAKKFMIWCYDMDDVTHLWYYPVIKNIKKNVVGFEKFGAIYLMFEAGCSSVHDWQTGLRGYIYSNLMWNSSLSVNSLFDEYMDNYYGVASEDIKRIIKILENYCIWVREIYDDYFVSTRNWSYRHAEVVSEKLLDRLLSIYSQAELKVSALLGREKEVLEKRIKAIKLTLLHMKINKINYEFYQCVEDTGTTQFSGQDLIPPNEGQTIYNVEMVWKVEKKLVIPPDVVKKVRELDVYSISDQIDFDNV